MHQQGKQALNICLLTSQHDKAVKIYKENSHECTGNNPIQSNQFYLCTKYQAKNPNNEIPKASKT